MNKLEFYQKVIVILGYMTFISKYPFVAAFMILFYKDDYIRMHMNRIMICGFLGTGIWALNYNDISIPYFSYNTFILLIGIIGIIQAFISSKHQLLLLDKIPLVRYYEGKPINIYLCIGITIVIVAISFFVRC